MSTYYDPGYWWRFSSHLVPQHCEGCGIITLALQRRNRKHSKVLCKFLQVRGPVSDGTRRSKFSKFTACMKLPYLPLALFFDTQLCIISCLKKKISPSFTETQLTLHCISLRCTKWSDTFLCCEVITTVGLVNTSITLHKYYFFLWWKYLRAIVLETLKCAIQDC